MNTRKIDLKEFQKRKLERSYISVYVVVKKMLVDTPDGIEPKKLCVFYGFTALGTRKIIAIYFEDTKDNRFWLNVFEDFKSRNLINIMLLVTPKNHNIERCAKIVYNDIEVIRSPEDIMASIDVFFASKTSRYLEIQLKNFLLADDLQTCKDKIELFKQQFLHNQLVLNVFEKQKDDIRKLLYQYYAIREIKRHINRLNELQPLCSDISSVQQHFLEYISSFERGLTYSKKGWVHLMNILYAVYPKKMEVYF